jgi:GTPase
LKDRDVVSRQCESSDNRASVQRAVLTGLCMPKEDPLDWPRRMDELARLAATAGAREVGRVVQNHTASSKTLVGKGKVEEIRQLAEDLEADLVIFLNDLSPSQHHNLQEAIGYPIVDRTVLILDIFAQHAVTRDGHIQVELAQLQHQLSRLTSHGQTLSQQGGGAGARIPIGTRGPGETKLEMDRRKIRQRITRLKQEVEHIRKVRGEQRRRRQRSSLPIISMVGYTNAGKSTLLNTLTQSDIYADDLLFATLDPTTRRMDFDSGKAALVSDTVGFITDLPEPLEAAFAATLEEIKYSDLLLHVVDVTSQRLDEEMSAVFTVLDHLEARDKPVLTVFNKIDQTPHISEHLLSRFAPAVCISALTGKGMDQLASQLETMCIPQERNLELFLPYSEGKLHALLYSKGSILSESSLDTGQRIHATIPEHLADPFLAFQVDE